LAKGKFQLSLMRWYMPKITSTEQYKAKLYQHISSGSEVELAFMNKRIDYFNQLNGLTLMLQMGGGNTPRSLFAV